MPSIRPSVFNQRERSDGGPFLLIEPAIEDDGASINVFFTDTPAEQRNGSHPIARLLNVSPEMLWIYPLNVRPDRSDYLGPKYGNLESIAVSRRVSEPYALPETVEDVEALLELLPDGFAKDYRLGLGLLWEYRAICEAFSGHDQVSRMIVHEGNENEATLDPPFFLLGRSRFHEIRKGSTGSAPATNATRGATRRTTPIICYSMPPTRSSIRA
jgi:hypothetical protein